MAKQRKRSAPPTTTSARKVPSKAKTTKLPKSAANGKRPAKKVTTSELIGPMTRARAKLAKQASADPTGQPAVGQATAASADATGQPKAATSAKSRKRKARDTAAEATDAETLPTLDFPVGTLQSPLPIEAVEARTLADLAGLNRDELLSVARAVKGQLAANGTPCSTSASIGCKRPILRWLQHRLPQAVDLDAMLPAVGVDCDFAQQIGEGTTSKVYRGTYTVDGNLLAIKKMDLEGTTTLTPEKIAEYAREEGQLHGSLKHANVLRLHRVLPSFPPAFILEHAKESLHSLVLRVGPLDEATAAQYALQIVHGLQHVHDSNVCRADIKMENILIGHDGQMRIADFGLSYAHPAPEGFIVGTRGTPFNCAPELWAEEPIVSDKMVDVWALGIIIYEMLTFRHPFSQKPLNVEQLDFDCAQIKAESQPGGAPFRDPAVCIKTHNYSSDMEPILSKDAKDLLDRIFTLLPGDRISLDDIATHAWMRPRASTGAVSSVLQWVRSALW